MVHTDSKVSYKNVVERYLKNKLKNHTVHPYEINSSDLTLSINKKGHTAF